MIAVVVKQQKETTSCAWITLSNNLIFSSRNNKKKLQDENRTERRGKKERNNKKKLQANKRYGDLYHYNRQETTKRNYKHPLEASYTATPSLGHLGNNKKKLQVSASVSTA